MPYWCVLSYRRLLCKLPSGFSRDLPPEKVATFSEGLRSLRSLHAESSST